LASLTSLSLHENFMLTLTPSHTDLSGAACKNSHCVTHYLTSQTFLYKFLSTTMNTELFHSLCLQHQRYLGRPTSNFSIISSQEHLDQSKLGL
jgi:hypothetical protein